MELVYKAERDEDFFRVCEKIRKENKGVYVSVSDIARQAISKQAASFYVSQREYSRIIRRRGIPNCKSIVKNQLHAEIYKKYTCIKNENQHLEVNEIAEIISMQQAPQFYISEKRAIDLYYQLLKRRPKNTRIISIHSET